MIEGETELDEAYIAYSKLACSEVMWDSEGKDVDTNVVRKLLSKYSDYFMEHVFGRDIFLTYRIPNPLVEKAERKIVTQTLQSIPLQADVASAFYKKEDRPCLGGDPALHDQGGGAPVAGQVLRQGDRWDRRPQPRRLR